MRLRRTIEADDTLDRRKQAITLKIPAQGFNERNGDLSTTGGRVKSLSRFRLP